jgi:hypothetical protein
MTSPQPYPIEPETRRFNALMLHFRDAGCCPNCAPYWAIKAVEVEFGRDGEVPPPVCLTPKVKCEAKMRGSWKTRPQAAQAKRAA